MKRMLVICLFFLVRNSPFYASQDPLEFIAGVWNSQEAIDYISHGGLDEATQPYQLKCNDVIYLGVQYHDTNTATVRKTIMRIHVLANDRILLEGDNDEDFRMYLDHEGFLIGREHEYVRAEKWESK